MRMKSFSLIIVLVFVLIVALPASADSWEDKITGGGLADPPGISITVSAWEDDAGNVSGQIQYSRFNGTLDFHATVECLGVFDEGTVAVVAGPAWAQVDSVAEGAWAVVEIGEGGVGSGDLVRVRLLDQTTAEYVCGHPSYSWGAILTDGNFNIRMK